MLSSSTHPDREKETSIIIYKSQKTEKKKKLPLIEILRIKSIN